MKFVSDEHHKLAVDWLASKDEAILFMGMGLGKTGSTLQAFCVHKLLGDSKGMLVIAPVQVCNMSWPNEVKKFSDFQWLRVANLRTKEGWAMLLAGTADIYLINYEALPLMVKKYFKKVRNLAFDTVVFDELTNAKNPKSKRINALKPYLAQMKRRWGLTGTPNSESYLELWAQLHVIDGGQRLGKSFTQYRNNYFHATDYMEYNWVLNDGADKKIAAKIADLCLTLTRGEYANFKEPKVVDIKIPLTKRVGELYEEMSAELLLSLGDEDNPIVAPNAAALTGKLLQITGGAVYREDRTVQVVHTLKLKALVELAAKIKGPMLIACNYVHEHRRIQGVLRGAVLFSGAKSRQAQTELLERWNRGQVPYLIADPRSIGHGLNLQDGGHTVCWYSLTHSNGRYDQFNCRLARRGQENLVTVYRLICTDTIDEAVSATLSEKDKGQRSLLKILTNYRKLKQKI